PSGKMKGKPQGAGRRPRAAPCLGGPPGAAPWRSCTGWAASEEDVEMKSSGSSGSGTESHGNDSHGHESVGSSNGNSKDSALLESSGSNKSSNSHSPSPPSSSNAFSLLSSEQDNPSTSGCSSEESAKAKTQKEVIKTLKELKLHLPAEKRHGNKSTTLSTLKYALRCVKQVEANEEYYQLLMINDSQPSGLDVSSYTIEEIDSITSEYTLKNNDIFAVAVSISTGRIVYISDQAASILNCKRDVFKNTKFVEFLTPQDVSVFYSFTTPYRLPSWSMSTGAESSPSDCMQEKSFFCRISGGKECEGDLQYYPFRMTPYLMKVQDTVHAEDQFCCLLFAERVHSGYDAPRIPADKRIFTTTHTPSCMFQDVDERAVPLLGYLPQDLIGTPVLLHLHPNDRPVMLGIHRKILQYAGQPFDHSSIRFCARNGEYIILDTSWSSFVNPWSSKVSFVIGRHKVRITRGPVNEDVFLSPTSAVAEMKTMDSDIQEITEQIHRLLLQPVHNSGSSGYSSLPRTDNIFSMTSSSDDNCSRDKMQDHQEQRTFQEICKGIHLQKNQEQQTNKADNKKSSSTPPAEASERSPAVVRPKDSAALLNPRESGAALEESRPAFQEEMTFNDQTIYSYQQISCLDSVFRYLESCNVPIPIKRKCQSLSNTTSSNSDDCQQKESTAPVLLKDQSDLSPLNGQDKKPSEAATAVVETSLPLPVPSKPESVVSITSQCSYSSTIVHVGDKKPQPDSEIIEDIPGTGETMESGQSPTAPSPFAVSPPSQEREAYKKLGLTKQVLAAHTQKEEQAFLYRVRELRGLSSLKEQSAAPTACSCKPGARPTTRRGTRNKKTKSKRAKQFESSESTASHRRRPPQPPRRSPWPTPPPFKDSPCRITPGPVPLPSDQAGPPPIHPPPFPTPLVTPIVALVLPNYVYPPLASGLPEAPNSPMHMHPFPQAAFSGCGGPASPPIFQSSCSSPLNLLELELCVDRQDGAALPPGGQGNNMAEREKGASGAQPNEREIKQASSRGDGNNSDINSLSSDMLDIILQEDSCSATSGSMGSGSNGCGTSASGTSNSGTSKSRESASGTSGSGKGSNNSSSYFGSVDSSQNSQKVKCHSSSSSSSKEKPMEMDQSEKFIKYVLQDPLWLLTANADKKVMMTYQLPSRDIQRVLQVDRDKLVQLHKKQPRFSEQQKKELIEVHPWMKKGGLPEAID
uniref:Period circadian protein homolog 2 n=1 Tax=Tetraodon nigroviridis TaxID=99883 RepID=H3DCQ3_TETNG